MAEVNRLSALDEIVTPLNVLSQLFLCSYTVYVPFLDFLLTKPVLLPCLPHRNVSHDFYVHPFDEQYDWSKKYRQLQIRKCAILHAVYLSFSLNCFHHPHLIPVPPSPSRVPFLSVFPNNTLTSHHSSAPRMRKLLTLNVFATNTGDLQLLNSFPPGCPQHFNLIFDTCVHQHHCAVR